LVKLTEWLKAEEKNCNLGKHPDNKKAAAKKGGRNMRRIKKKNKVIKAI